MRAPFVLREAFAVMTSFSHSQRPRTVATIEARMGSSRLPGKVLMPANGRPMLAHLLDRLWAVPSIDEIVLATTTSAGDAELEAFAAEHGVRCFRGSEDDVLERVIGAASSEGAELVVEITGDCPIIDPEIVEQTIRTFLCNDCQYASNVVVRSYPDGMDTQVFSLETLCRSGAMTDDPRDREHVTRHIRLHPELFPAVHLVAPPALTWPELGLTLDEEADLELLRRLIEHFGDEHPLFGCGDALRVLRDQHSEWLHLNEAVARRALP